MFSIFYFVAICLPLKTFSCMFCPYYAPLFWHFAALFSNVAKCLLLKPNPNPDVFIPNHNQLVLWLRTYWIDLVVPVLLVGTGFSISLCWWANCKCETELDPTWFNWTDWTFLIKAQTQSYKISQFIINVRTKKQTLTVTMINLWSGTD